jgi:ParB family chromosome partitioning protein
MRINIRLSELVLNRRNPRRVKPERDAHRRLVASIRAYGLLQPLVVRPTIDDPKSFRVIAGQRRLAALREVHRGDGDPKVSCEVRDADDATTEAIGLAENFAREPMHPLDEAEAFARLAREDAKGVDAIAADFGVTDRYVRQRMKLATLADVVKAAYRDGGIDTGTAEAFAAVPPKRQEQVWQEIGGNPQHAHHVRNVIEHGWIDAAHALFDITALPEPAVSRDLFGERVLIERQAFLAAQAEALEAERSALAEDGWAEVVVAPQSDVQDRLWAMEAAPVDYDDETTVSLAKLDRRRQKWDAKLEEVDEADEAAQERIGNRLDALDAEAEQVQQAGQTHYGETAKATGTAFLILDPDGRVRREYRTPRHRHQPGTTNGNGHVDGVTVGQPKPPTPDDLKEGQLATTFALEALCVREALLQDATARKRVLALILHEKVRSEALAVRHEANAVTLHADKAEGLTSASCDELRRRRAEDDPFKDDYSIDEAEAYARLADVPDATLDDLIALLAVECVTTQLVRGTPLVRRLAGELGVNVRQQWRPDAAWLAGYQKGQLTHLMAELRGPVYDPRQERRKKSELVDALAALFTDAAEGRLDDPKLAQRLNGWLPVNLRPESEQPASPTNGRHR